MTRMTLIDIKAAAEAGGRSIPIRGAPLQQIWLRMRKTAG